MSLKYHAIRPGEPIPPGEPTRHITRRGYVRLRWSVHPHQRIEIFEHRLVVGNPAGYDVHHKNGIRTDNRPENLELISHSAHSRIHNKPKVDMDAVKADYEAGMALPQLAEKYQHNNGNLSRMLRSRGVRMRTSSDYKTAIDLNTLKQMHDAGESLPAIAAALGTSVTIVRNRAKELGIQSRPVGRPRAQ